MLRLLLLLVLIAFVARAFWRVMDGVIDGFRGDGSIGARAQSASRSVQMVRDPVCGTYVIPDRAVTILDGGRSLYFCSTRCRDTFTSKPTSPERARA